MQDATGKRVGYLNHGANWIICQASGETVHSGNYYNRWWGYTEANDQHFGWVNAVWASGGSDDGQFGAAPNCGSTYGSPPTTAAPTPTPHPHTHADTDTHTEPDAHARSVSARAGSVPFHRPRQARLFLLYRRRRDPRRDARVRGEQTHRLPQHGENWVLCQQTGAQFGVGNGTVNVWWAYTEANDKRYGWVNAVFGRGGANNGEFEGVPNCDGTRGLPPGVSPPKPKPKPTPPPAPPKNMVALGDSYASGEGTEPTTDGTCFRSTQAYGYLVASTLGYDLTGFEACGGATTSSVMNDQLGALSASTTLVTLSVGGDDADFVGVLARCAGSLGIFTGPCKNFIKKESGIIRTELPGRLDRLYSAIRGDSPKAKVVVVGYPYIFYGACDKSAPLQWLNPPTDLLDNTIRAAAARHGFTFVDLRNPFKGHSACDEGAWINHLYTHDPYKSFHPNAAGYREIAKLVEGAV